MDRKRKRCRVDWMLTCRQDRYKNRSRIKTASPYNQMHSGDKQIKIKRNYMKLWNLFNINFLLRVQLKHPNLNIAPTLCQYVSNLSTMRWHPANSPVNWFNCQSTWMIQQWDRNSKDHQKIVLSTHADPREVDLKIGNTHFFPESDHLTGFISLTGFRVRSGICAQVTNKPPYELAISRISIGVGHRFGQVSVLAVVSSKNYPGKLEWTLNANHLKFNGRLNQIHLV